MSAEFRLLQSEPSQAPAAWRSRSIAAAVLSAIMGMGVLLTLTQSNGAPLHISSASMRGSYEDALHAIQVPSVSQNPLLYQVSGRQWLYELGLKAGLGRALKLNEVPLSEFQNLKDQGFEIFYFMGAWSLGAYALNLDRTSPDSAKDFSTELPGYTSKDIIGSPFAITAYSVNPDIGSNDDMKAFSDALHSIGLQLCLDFVPNHSAIDNPWVASSPDMYVQRPGSWSSDANMYVNVNGRDFSYGRDPYSGAWKDTVQLNYWNQRTADAMTAQLLFVAQFADLARSDMAMLLLNDVIEHTWGNQLRALGYNRPGAEFWPNAIKTVKAQHPKFKLMAEVYTYGITNPAEDVTLRNFGFDFTYDKLTLDKLRARNVGDLRGYISNMGANLARTSHFVENHDEQRAVATLGGSNPAITGAAAALTLPGLRFVHHGQMIGKTHKLGVHLLRSPDEPVNVAVQNFYNAFLPVLKDAAFQGQWSYVDLGSDGTAWRMIGWRWSSQTSKILVVVNHSDTEAWGNAYVPDASTDSGSITEMLTGAVYPRASKTIVVRLDPFAVQIFKY